MGTKKNSTVTSQKGISDNSDVLEDVAPESLHAPRLGYTRMLEIAVADVEEPPPKLPAPTERITRARAHAKNDASPFEDSPPKVARKKDGKKKRKVGAQVPKKGRQ